MIVYAFLNYVAVTNNRNELLKLMLLLIATVLCNLYFINSWYCSHSSFLSLSPILSPHVFLTPSLLCQNKYSQISALIASIIS